MEQRISHKESFHLKSVKVTNGHVSSQSPEWISEKLSRVVPVSWTLQTKAPARWMNSLRIEPHSRFGKLFPEKFRAEYSENGVHWRPLFREVKYRGTGSRIRYFSLIRFQFIKIIALCDRKSAEKEGFQIAIGTVTAFIGGIQKIETSSEFDRLWIKENIIDGRTDYGWATQRRKEPVEDWIRFDLGFGYPISELRLLSAPEAKNSESLFPKGFRILHSQDKIHWDVIIQHQDYLSEANTWYSWKFPRIPTRYLQVSIIDPNQDMKLLYQSKIAEMEIYATSDYELFSPAGSGFQFRTASTVQSGIVRLAVHGEKGEGVALQSSDPRLQEATETETGIVELAAHEETRPRRVVQSDDPRLNKADTQSYGIVRLARPAESHAERVVSSDDPRLNEASQSQAGLVRLARNGESASGAVVEANDRRLNIASTSSPGIVQFSVNQEAHPNRVISSNDSRLQPATSENAGITNYARHWEQMKNTAVQADDPRLSSATSQKKGIVRLARDREKAEGVVLQSNDPRLDTATSSRAGIVRIAKDGEKTADLVVSATDSRLEDPRPPLLHTHDYAEKKHDFNSHEGTLHISKNQGMGYQGWISPPKNYAPIRGGNSGSGAGIVGESISGEGVFAMGVRSGVLGISPKSGAGVLGLSHEGIGGHFISEKDCSLVAGGSTRGIKSSPYAFLSQGMSAFEDTVFLNKKSCVAISFPKNFQEVFQEGDTVTLQGRSGFLSRVKSYGDTRIIGIVVDSASLIMRTNLSQKTSDAPEKKNPKNQTSESHLVAILGIVKAKVSAYFAPIERGDVLVSASNEAGYLQKLDPNRYQAGMICARSLENLGKGKGLIQVIILCG